MQVLQRTLCFRAPHSRFLLVAPGFEFFHCVWQLDQSSEITSPAKPTS